MATERRAEPDVAADPREVTTDSDDSFVGRVAGDEAGDAGETGAERRARRAAAED